MLFQCNKRRVKCAVKQDFASVNSIAFIIVKKSISLCYIYKASHDVSALPQSPTFLVTARGSVKGFVYSVLCLEQVRRLIAEV